MPTETGKRTTGLVLRLTAGALLCLGLAESARSQAPVPQAQPAPPARSPIPVELPPPSQVFPDGGFPTNLLPEVPIPERTPQPGPGSLFTPLPPASPNYARPGVGARPIADYAPPGYLPRDPQGGIGATLYQPVPIPTPEQMPTDLDREKFVTRGLYPGTFLVPGTNTSFKWYGFVRLDGIYDFNPIGGTDSFVTAQIPVPQGRGQNVSVNPRYSRLGLDTWTPTPVFDWNVHTRLEVDFFNGNSSGSFGSFPLRLRYAYADFGPFRVGQAASAFMDYDVFPNVLDYQGPNGMVLMRQAIARVTLPVSDRLFVALAVEQPYSDIQWFQDGEFVVNPGNGIVTTPGVPRNVQDMPDFTGNVRYETDFGHVQVAGVLRKLTFQPGIGTDMNRLGAGVNLTADVHPWALLMQSNPLRKDNPTALERCRLLGGYAVGRGINRYLQDTNGLGLDAVADPVDGFHALYSVGWFACYEHWWTEKWASNICYGELHTALPDALPPDTYQAGKYLAANLIWLPFPRLGIGIEYLYGEREDKDGERGFAHRIQTAVQYSF